MQTYGELQNKFWLSIPISFVLIHVFLSKPIWVNIYMEFASTCAFSNTVGSYIFLVFSSKVVGLQ